MGNDDKFIRLAALPETKKRIISGAGYTVEVIERWDCILGERIKWLPGIYNGYKITTIGEQVFNEQYR